MKYLGRIIGTLLGYLMARIPGAIIGFFVGYFFDKAFQQQAIIQGLFHGKGHREKTQAAFLKATFQIIGNVAKADGRVSPTEIQEAERIMRQLRLQGEARKSAISYFQEGKSAEFNLDTTLNELIGVIKNQHLLISMFIEIQLQAAHAEGFLTDAKRARLVYVSERLGFDRVAFARLNSMYQAEEKFKDYQRTHYHQQYKKAHQGSATSEAYKILGIEKAATDAEVKKAYRKLMSTHHPDKLIAQGLPPEMIRLATEKTQEIKAAYELIVETRAK
ncbi:MAG: co-chaperone DjlA [Gammaproteobacteria bacterium]